jgi:glutathione S-transferase
MLTLYVAPGASSFAVHIALHEIGVPFEAKPMSFRNHDTRSPEFLKLNPAGKIPTLLIDGRPLTEVAGILFYLAKRFPDAGLLPHGNIEAEAQAISWMSFIASALHPARRQGLDHVRQVYRISDKTGRLARITRSQTFICSGSTGGCSIRCIRSLANFPTSTRIMRG